MGKTVKVSKMFTPLPFTTKEIPCADSSNAGDKKCTVGFV